ncbi:MAG: trypsin-like peptidase domain-containing protein, partial [Phycisphaeraceae bacterium]|nr:trypsin-like peptidase domain-containing protein [Phycisphaeraceae bacterium]
LVVSAAHAFLKRKMRIEARTADGERLPTKLIAFDRGHDLALLQVQAKDRKFKFLPIAKTMPEPGERMYLFGAAYYRHHIMVSGFMARAEPAYEYLPNLHQYVRIYHISAPSPPGTSGGCWINTVGEVVGVQSAFMNLKDSGGAGIASASPAEAIARLVAAKKTRRIATLGCGLEEFWTQPVGYIRRYRKGSEGLVPVLIKKDGPADRAGLKGEMLIRALDGKPVPTRRKAIDYIRSKKPGDKVVVSVDRPDRQGSEKITVELGELPSDIPE